MRPCMKYEKKRRQIRLPEQVLSKVVAVLQSWKMGSHLKLMIQLQDFQCSMSKAGKLVAMEIVQHIGQGNENICCEMYEKV